MSWKKRVSQFWDKEKEGLFTIRHTILGLNAFPLTEGTLTAEVWKVWCPSSIILVLVTTSDCLQNKNIWQEKEQRTRKLWRRSTFFSKFEAFSRPGLSGLCHQAQGKWPLYILLRRGRRDRTFPDLINSFERIFKELFRTVGIFLLAWLVPELSQLNRETVFGPPRPSRSDFSGSDQFCWTDF